MVTPFSTAMLPVLAQVVGAIAGLSTLALFPPARGTILLVSLTGQSVGGIADAAIAAGGRIARRGPFDHSLVVVAERARLIGLSRRGLVPLAAPAMLCGE